MKKPAYRFARRTKGMTASIIREILKVSSRPGVISFAGGLPAPESFPLEQFGDAVNETLRLDGTRALQYMVTEGHDGLKQYLCGWLGKQGIKALPENMLLVNGSQQALDLLAKVFLNPEDAFLVEDPTYLGAVQCFNAYETRYKTVPIDVHGMRTDLLEKTLTSSVRFIYTMPTFQNPAGTTMPLERRKQLISEARKKGVPIVEDDPYGVLRFKGRVEPSLFALAKGKGVIYSSTFSKLLSPGIRLGFIVAEPDVIRQLIFAKQAADLQTNSFIQHAVYHYCKDGHFERHIPFIIEDYRRRAGVMLEAMRLHFPPEVEYVEPDGGMFVWCRLPKGMKASALFKKAIRRGVAFVDGNVFYANGGGENTLRLNFTNSTDDAIRTGIERLGMAIRTSL